MTATLDAELDFRTAWWEHAATCRSLIERHGARAVCEIGGGRSPLFSRAEVAELGLAYTVLDISAEELAEAPTGYDTLCADICSPALTDGEARFDLMFSKMVAEHVPDGERMHRNVHQLLRPGGIAFHFFPTLFAPVFVVNRLLPERLTHWALERGQPRDAPKFPALYSKCFGPTGRMHRFYSDLGYEVLEYRPFYGYEYLDRVPVLGRIDAGFWAWSARRHSARFTSFAYLVLRRPPLTER